MIYTKCVIFNVVSNNFKEKTLLLLLTKNIQYTMLYFFILVLNTVIDFLWACSNQQGPVQHKIALV